MTIEKLYSHGGGEVSNHKDSKQNHGTAKSTNTRVVGSPAEDPVIKTMNPTQELEDQHTRNISTRK